MKDKIALAIPTYNATENFKEVCNLIKKEAGGIVDTFLIVDSQSKDETVKIAKEANFNVEIIDKTSFNHSKTRSEIAKKFYKEGYKYLILLTQDVFLQDDAIKNLLTFIKSDEKLGAVFGKQEVDLRNGNLFEHYARSFNYPASNLIKSKNDISKLGIKTIFSSDAFIIYDLKILNEVGYFGDKNIVNEDMFVAHKIIEAGYKIGYCADAKVYHSHNYSIFGEYKRYKPIGKFFKENKELLSKYPNTLNSGIKLALGEIKFLKEQKKTSQIPRSILRNAAKFLAFKVGYYFG